MKMIKDKLARCFRGTSFKTFSQLQAACATIQRIINSHPLTFISNETTGNFPVTPSMFLHVNAEDGRTTPWAIDATPDMVLPLHDAKLQQLAQARRNFTKRLWNTFYDAYISLLKRCHATATKENRTIAEGQIVLFKRHDVFKPSATRKEWCLARIKKLYPGKDGVTRVADIEVSNPRGHGTVVLERQTTKFIAPLEADLYPDKKATQN
jgi:hypothetical protein